MNTIELLKSMASSTIGNYVLPGLDSSLIGKGDGQLGNVMLFEASRDQRMSVTPHSHKFDLATFVLRGRATNHIWFPGEEGHHDEFSLVETTPVDGGLGNGMTWKQGDRGPWTRTSRAYCTGESYSMSYDEIHSVDFSRDAILLFIEGPQVSASSTALLPVVDGEVLDTLRVEPWMFKR